MGTLLLIIKYLKYRDNYISSWIQALKIIWTTNYTHM